MGKRSAIWAGAFALSALLSVPAGAAVKAKTYTVASPDGTKVITVTAGDTLSYSVAASGRQLVKQAKVTLITADRSYGVRPKVKKAVSRKVADVIKPVVPMKRSEIEDAYNQLHLDLDGDYAVEFRAYDNGVAHRFITSAKDSINVFDEVYDVTFTPGLLANLQQPAGFKTSYEESYTHKPMSEWTPEDRMSTLPVLLQGDGGECVLVSESDVMDYPCMFLKGTGADGFYATYPKVPLKFGDDGDRSVKILEEAPYIARTTGSRAFPWRFMAIGSAADIAEQTLAVQLAGRNQLADTSWIRPGQASWEWWNGAMPYGDDVEFESGFNMNTYKYFIDFAAKYGIPYIVMDEGWALDTRDPYTPNPEVDVHEIVRYGKERGVGVILWLTWLTVENNFDLFKTVADWGVKGLKIDFMDRSDQWMVNFYERVIREAAANNLLVDFHGAFKPAGLEQKYPNLLAYEGVRGMEQMGGCTPDNTLYLPFMRNAVGPMDYTPGAMLSMQPERYVSRRPNSASIGTRAYQMALFVVLESGLQMLADNPTLYYRNDACTRFISDVPVTWDETKVIEAEPGEYYIVAKRKGDTWYVGGITNGKEKHREFSLALDFLSPGAGYTMEAFSDGVNAHQQAMDYRRTEQQVSSKTVIPVRMARNGGWTAVIKPM